MSGKAPQLHLFPLMLPAGGRDGHIPPVWGAGGMVTVQPGLCIPLRSVSRSGARGVSAVDASRSPEGAAGRAGLLHWLAKAGCSALECLSQGLLQFGKQWSLQSQGGCWPGQCTEDHWKTGKWWASSPASAPGSSWQLSGRSPRTS